MKLRGYQTFALAFVLVLGLIGFGWKVIAEAPTLSKSPYATAGPLSQPRLFAEGVISTSDDESSLTFTPDGKTVYFTKTSPGTVSPALPVIGVSHFEKGQWTPPDIAPFSGQYRDLYPCISPDGSKFFFASLRPVDGQPKRDLDLWVMEKTPTGWSEPKNLGAPINGPAHDLSPSVTADGTLYFASIRPGGKAPGVPGIYRSKLVDGKYAEPENLGDPINTVNGEIEPCIAPDESFLVFTSSGRPDEIVGIHTAYNRGDLYISFRKDGLWTPAKNLGPPINSGGAESAPSLSPDGKYFFFTSDRGFATYRLEKRLAYLELMTKLRSTFNGRGNIYQIDISALGIK